MRLCIIRQHRAGPAGLRLKRPLAVRPPNSLSPYGTPYRTLPPHHPKAGGLRLNRAPRIAPYRRFTPRLAVGGRSHPPLARERRAEMGEAGDAACPISTG